MAPNSSQKRAQVAKTVVSAVVPAFLPFPSLWTALTTMALPRIPGMVRAAAGELIGKVFPAPTIGDLAANAASKYAPSIAPIVAAFAVLSLTQIAGILKICKSLKSLLTPAPAVAASEQRFVYNDHMQLKRQVPWTIVFTVLSLVSLRYGKTVVKSKYSITPRYWGMVYLVVALIRAYGLFEWARNKSPIGARLTTKLVSMTLVAGPLSSSQQRQVFVDTPVVRAGPTRNHTHGKSASARNAGSATAALAARSLGLEPYFVQQSLSDIRKMRDGDRSFHWAKDIAVPPKEFHFDPEKQAAVLVDVDYYIDMPNLLARYPGTYFVSTFQPTATALGSGEYTFRFLEDGKVLYRVSGGAEYEHFVWDYKGDTLLVEVSDILTKSIVAYHIDRKLIDEHHVVVMLTVIGKFTAPSLIPTSLILEGRSLERLKPVYGNHVVLEVVRPEGLTRSVSILGDHISVTMPKTQMDAVHAVAMVAKVPITPAMVASNVAPSDPVGLPTERMPPGHAAVLASYLRAGVPHNPPVVYPPSEGLVPIYFAKHDYDAPVPMAGFGSPLIGPCYGYSDSIASDDRCIAGRVEAFTSQSGVCQIPPKLAGYMVEFSERLIPVAHKGHPVGLDEVEEHQPRPSQRAILHEAHMSGPFYRRMWRSFVKKETGVKPSDPRNISTATPQAKLAYSSFLYAFHESVMANQEWYAFNKTPAGCANRVAHILRDAKHAVPSDASRFDGHVKWLARVLERIIMLRFFSQEHHSELNERLDEQVGLPGVTAEGRKYASGYTRASGSSETSDLNSVDTAFIGYCGWRETMVNGVCLTPDQAWAKLGIYGGDDSLEGEIDPQALARSAKLMGQSYKTKVIPRGCVGVEFLNRQFGPDVWTGDVNSMANPSRLLSKLWVGPATLPDPLQRFAERASGYYRMDRNSPVIGEICRVSHELLGEREDGLLMPWAGKHGLDTNWPNEDSGWMVDVFNTFIPDFDWDRFYDWIWQVKFHADPALLLCAPLCTAAPESTPLPSVSAVLADTLVQVDEEPQVLSRSPPEKVTQGELPQALVQAVALVPELGVNAMKKVDIDSHIKPKKEQAKPKAVRDPSAKERKYWLIYPGETKPRPVSKEEFEKRPDLWQPKRGMTQDQLISWMKWQARAAKKAGVLLPHVVA